jgi:FlaA1/EpsC-like NDP-sugar epimerase/EAL domain-containing protein (putative c-di-GMP-specific phosphodiesterase class I)
MLNDIPLFDIRLSRIYASLSSLTNYHLYQVDICIFLMAPFIALGLRLESLKDIQNWTHWGLFITAISFVIAKLVVLWHTGFYQRYWRYAGTDELMFIAGLGLAMAIVNIICLNIIYFLLSPPNLPRSLPLLDAMISFIGISLVRYSIRFADRSHRRSQANASGKRLLIVGAGAAGVALAEEMQRYPDLGYLPIGFIDDDPTKQGLKIRNIPIVGDRYHIPELVQTLKIHDVIIAMPSASGQVVREIVNLCKAIGIKASTLPRLDEILNGPIRLESIRDVNIEDLLRREPIQTEVQSVVDFLNGKTILVTGAGGSIGGELCRQMYRCHPKTMILMGHGENSVFNIQQELEQLAQLLKHHENALQDDVQLVVVIADLRSYSRLNHLFTQYKPDIVFHAAAHKHVPLMELNSPEAITNNVMGTKNLLDLSIQHQTEHFVMISSDKVVNPTNVMGASKRVAEMLVLQAAKISSKHFAVVRFGNVLGSRGSVVPTFQKQIAQGGPITITHPEISRYFMTIPEAVQLVLQASVLSRSGGEIFMLNMGKPVKIVDLAEDLIRLSGYEVGRDIGIVFTGLRPGEKLYEELLLPGEEYESTAHEKILVVKNATNIVPDNLDIVLDALYAAAAQDNQTLILSILEQLVTGYQPKYETANSIRRVQRLVEPDLVAVQTSNQHRTDAHSPVNCERRVEQDIKLSQALDRGELCLHYQPIFQLENSKLIGFEALLRRKHPQKGVLLPHKFLALAEKLGRLTSISFWVIGEVCRQLSIWQEEYILGQSLTISINLSNQDLLEPNLIDHIKNHLQKNILDPSCLRLEIPEIDIVNHPTSLGPIISQLKEIGVQLQIDNFGKTHSEGGQFDSFPNLFYEEFDRLKLDRRWISRIEHDSKSLERLKVIATIARNSGIEITAAGVETSEQLAQLISIHCRYGQGYLFSKPIANDKAECLIGSNNFTPCQTSTIKV